MNSFDLPCYGSGLRKKIHTKAVVIVSRRGGILEVALPWGEGSDLSGEGFPWVETMNNPTKVLQQHSTDWELP